MEMKKWILIGVEKETIPNCSMCNTKIKWVCWIRNIDTLEEIPVGSTCCSNMLSKSDNKKIKTETDIFKKVVKCNKLIKKYGLKHSIKEVAHWLGTYHFSDTNLKKHYPEYYEALYL
jgi:hypothetical protein